MSFMKMSFPHLLRSPEGRYTTLLSYLDYTLNWVSLSWWLILTSSVQSDQVWSVHGICEHLSGVLHRVVCVSCNHTIISLFGIIKNPEHLNTMKLTFMGLKLCCIHASWKENKRKSSIWYCSKVWRQLKNKQKKKYKNILAFNMLICSSSNIYYYYQHWKLLCCFISSYYCGFFIGLFDE